MARADKALPLDEAIRDSSTIMRTSIIDDDQPSAPQTRHGDRPDAIPRPDHRPDRDEIELADVRDGRIIAKLVEHCGGDRSHSRTVQNPSDSPACPRSGQRHGDGSATGSRPR